MKINSNSKSNTILTLSFWKKRWEKYGSAILLALQILHFGSIAPEALLRLTEYLPVPDSNFVIKGLTDFVDTQNSGNCEPNWKK